MEAGTSPQDPGDFEWTYKHHGSGPVMQGNGRVDVTCYPKAYVIAGNV